jgi:hypothetical protein
MSRRGKTISRVVVITAVVAALGLFGLYVYDASVTNALVAKFKVYKPGDAFAKVEAEQGPPDRMEEVQGSWKWGRRMRSVPAHVTHVATYYRQITPQICGFLHDNGGVIVEVDLFAGY